SLDWNQLGGGSHCELDSISGLRGLHIPTIRTDCAAGCLSHGGSSPAGLEAPGARDAVAGDAAEDILTENARRGGRLASTSAEATWQATSWPGSTGLSRGGTRAHSSMASGPR